LRRFIAILSAIAGPAGSAGAQDLNLSGMVDLRLVAPSGQMSNMDGGFGKLRWGDGRGSPVIPDLAAAVLRGSLGLTPELRITAEFRYDPRQKTTIDLLDAYVRYRPVSTSRWRWSVKAGAFFPPVSLENTNIGWTPEWTLTPSAINSWVGNELRIIGAETMLEWRGDQDRFEFVAAAYGLNEPAGTAIDAYGWTFSDRPTGMLDHIRLPNANGRNGPATYSDPFRQFDHSVGWYTGISWERPDIGRLALLRYDNAADPSAQDATQIGWRTQFWNLGASTEIGPVTILAQFLVGSTVVAPVGGDIGRTDFWGYYILAGIERGDWRFAIRFDQFATRETALDSAVKGDEHGIAGTAAVTWTPRKNLNLIGEVIAIDYTREQRILIGKTPHVTEVQALLALRVSF